MIASYNHQNILLTTKSAATKNFTIIVIMINQAETRKWEGAPLITRWLKSRKIDHQVANTKLIKNIYKVIFKKSDHQVAN